ncbi:hypothetical protein A2856_01045 [Candidatus Uhrbacteria bacterium RIFCSPHIGHO2_01_FULL_63_20]|uniref:Uncharacterized protein n=1 Tax=Candidatus Uhrbacteria bacterium RIFCSPHIGHO2_01_FULL_63_20 TaxID=1802385 RepID=A0A1F7TM35_9BACT|nr:MAG: hypothetical protein A2856_01045 [Candidatus Uhrbacteria bacterium RIFCSPHIGHO2_01_FULL_63_20]
MRLIFALSLILTGCSHAPEVPRPDPRCAHADAQADLERAKADRRRTFELSARDVARIAEKVDRLVTQGLNAKNASQRPLTAEQTMQADGRLRGVRGILLAEHDHLLDIASHADDPFAGDDVRSSCREVVAKTDAELAQTRNVVTSALTEFQIVADEYGLPVSIQVDSSSPAP